jgi:UPF0288 family protein (methanogenesis marker protein 3)
MSKSVIELVAVIEKLVDEAIDRKLPNVHEVVARLSEELSRQRGTDAEVFAQLVASGNVFLKIKTAAAIADCHDKSITRALAVGDLRRYGLREDPRIRLGDLLNYMARQEQAEAPEAIRERARAVVRGSTRTPP